MPENLLYSDLVSENEFAIRSYLLNVSAGYGVISFFTGAKQTKLASFLNYKSRFYKN